TVFVGTFLGSMCALIHTTLPAGALKPFHETGLPDIALPLGGITQTNDGGTVMLQVCVTVFVATLPDESTTSPVKLSVPTAVGVPVIAPVVEFNDSGAMLPDAIE